MFVKLNNPLFLLIWLIIPVIWIMIYRSFGKEGSRRSKLLIGGLRTLLILLLGLILSDPRMMTHSDRVNLFFCLDTSLSIAQEERAKAENFINRSIRNMGKQDTAGLIVFGKHPSMEIPLKEDFQLNPVQSDVNKNLTNISEALQMAIGKFPQKGKNKILLFTDGNENLRNSVDMAHLAGSLGVEIMPVPLASWFGKNEVFVKRLDTPPLVPLETPFQIRIDIMGSQAGRGKLILFKDDNLLAGKNIHIQSGNNTFFFSDTLEEPGLHLYRAVVNFPGDGFFQNNEGLSFTKSVRKSRILYLSDNQDSSNPVAEALKLQGLNLEPEAIEGFSGSLNEVLEYNAVILDNVSGRSMSFAAMDNIEKYVKDLGGGLIMIGGEKSFGAGYYGKTLVEKALPVYMDVPTDLKLSELCIIFIIDKSSSMITDYSGKTKLEMAKIAAFSSIEMLNPTDRIGIIAFDSQFKWIVPIINAKERQRIADSLSRIKEGGGTILYPALESAFNVLKRIKSNRKHIIVLSDGETDKADFKSIVQDMSRQGISVSTVCIGRHSDTELMKSIAEWGQGRYYYTEKPEDIPNIFTGETKIVARKIITEQVLQPSVTDSTEILQGIEPDLPVIHGQVVTYPKPGADVPIRTVEGPLLATWRYGLGRSVAFASDLSGRWGREWLQWEHYGQFLSQMVKWAQRKEVEETYTASMDRKGERGTFRVDAVSMENRFINNQDLRVKILFPSGMERTIDLDQVSPGRYQGDFSAEEIGKYYFTLFSETRNKIGSTHVFGFGIPYTDEFKAVDVNYSLLEELAFVTGGKVLPVDEDPPDLFRAASGSVGYDRSLWPILTFVFLFLLLADVAARKLIPYS